MVCIWKAFERKIKDRKVLAAAILEANILDELVKLYNAIKIQGYRGVTNI